MNFRAGLGDIKLRSVLPTDNARNNDKAAQILQKVLTWELSDPRWERIAALLDVMAAAQRTGDHDGLRQATANLKAEGPTRITRIGAAPTGPPPPPIREQINTLIHLLSGTHDDSGEDGSESR
ncbi:hypothetical protein Acor_80880 [Acrocarpospora corrugata]|uniref:CATRA-Associated Small Protein domain-containing protein n=1 Tax=Acrocarpospora corrugata TaxID=35763 RepID=A0A5M3WCE5_9ACTN|nr:CATRA system-associated protein [Acrocarpospora corrugata]GES06019.1 hypothetical protein Acor_80880 [Acrocarpospora corrugata]